MENTSTCWEATMVMTDYVSRLQVCPFVRGTAKFVCLLSLLGKQPGTTESDLC